MPDWFTEDEARYQEVFFEVWQRIPAWARLAVNGYDIRYTGDVACKVNWAGRQDETGLESAANMQFIIGGSGLYIEFSINKTYVDSLQYYDDVLFLIAHELAHVATGHATAGLAISINSGMTDAHREHFTHYQEWQADCLAVAWGFRLHTHDHQRRKMLDYFKHVTDKMTCQAA
jgi:hypothetical protein